MLDTIEIHRFSPLDEALKTYERRFGALPDWLDELSGGRVLALLRQALRRGAPLSAADVVF